MLHERRRNPEVSETRLAILSDQDVALDRLRISVWARSILRFTYWTDATVQNTQPMKVHEATTRLCKLL